MDKPAFVLPAHKVYESSGGYAFSCPYWTMTWYYSKKESADFCLAGHLQYPVAPCVGDSPVVTGEFYLHPDPEITDHGICIVAHRPIPKEGYRDHCVCGRYWPDERCKTDVWFIATCLDCDFLPPRLSKPFRDEGERDSWTMDHIHFTQHRVVRSQHNGV